MLLACLLVLLVSVSVWVRLRWSRVRGYWAARGVPHHPPHPLLGSLTFLQRQNPVYWMRKIYNDFKAPYVGIWLFWKPALVINSPELAKRILVKDSDNFRNRFLSSGKSDPIGRLNIFTVNDPLWSSARRRLTAVFTGAKLRNLEGLIREKVDDLVQRYNAEMDKSHNDINIRDINTDYTTDVIGEAAFGVQSQATRTGDSIIRKVTKDFMKFSVFRGLSWSSIFFFPALVDIFGFSLFPKETTSFLSRVFREIITQRGGLDKPVKEPKDLLDALLKMRQEAAAEKEDMTEDFLLAQATIFLQGGFDTTGSALTWTYQELAHSPEVQEKLHRELVEAREKLGREFDANDLAEIPYLNAVIKEVVRKYPPMGWLDRIAANDYKVDEKLTIPAGTPVYVNATGLMMDPEYFPDPEVFDPERFMPGNEKNIKPYTYMPFGEGPRNCIGMRFAYLSMRYALAAIIRNFEIRAPADAGPPSEWKVEHRGLFFMPAGQVRLVFTPRN